MFSYKDVITKAKMIEKRYEDYKNKGKAPFYIPFKGLGWTISPSSRDQSQLYTSDKNGFRITSPNDGKADQELPKIAFWGNSLIFGGEVQDQDSWLWLLQKELKDKYKIINGGVGGYGTDQGYLRFEKMDTVIEAEKAFLSYSTADLLRNINIQRMFVDQNTDLIFLKPRFELAPQGLKFIEPPYADYQNLATVLKNRKTKKFLKNHDPFYPNTLRRIFLKGLEETGIIEGKIDFGKSNMDYALKVTFKIIEKFIQHCNKKNTEGYVILLPVFTGKYISGKDFDLMIKWIKRKKYNFIDVREAFREKTKIKNEELFNSHNHYTRLSGEIIANYVARQILNYR